MPDTDVRARLDQAIDRLDDAARRRLLDWAVMVGPDRPGRDGVSIESAGPLADMLHITNVSAAGGRSVNRLDVSAELLNPHGVLHGGAVYTMVDYGMGGATMSAVQPGESCATIEIKVSYLAAVRGGTLTAGTQVIKQGRTVVFLESRVTAEDGRLVATASGSFAIISADRR